MTFKYRIFPICNVVILRPKGFASEIILKGGSQNWGDFVGVRCTNSNEKHCSEVFTNAASDMLAAYSVEWQGVGNAEDGRRRGVIESTLRNLGMHCGCSPCYSRESNLLSEDKARKLKDRT